MVESKSSKTFNYLGQDEYMILITQKISGKEAEGIYSNKIAFKRWLI